MEEQRILLIHERYEGMAHRSSVKRAQGSQLTSATVDTPLRSLALDPLTPVMLAARCCRTTDSPSAARTSFVPCAQLLCVIATGRETSTRSLQNSNCRILHRLDIAACAEGLSQASCTRGTACTVNLHTRQHRPLQQSLPSGLQLVPAACNPHYDESILWALVLRYDGRPIPTCMRSKSSTLDGQQQLHTPTTRRDMVTTALRAGD